MPNDCEEIKMLFQMSKLLLIFVAAMFTGACAGDTIVHHYAICPKWVEKSEDEYKYLKRQGRGAGYNNLINTIEHQRAFCKYLDHKW